MLCRDPGRFESSRARPSFDAPGFRLAILTFHFEVQSDMRVLPENVGQNTGDFYRFIRELGTRMMAEYRRRNGERSESDNEFDCFHVPVSIRDKEQHR